MDERIRKKMKTYKHLYEEFISEENIKLAIRNGTKKKRHRPLFCIFRKNCASVPEERSAIPLQTEQSSAG